MSDSYNPNALGGGGWIATAACGCHRGWISEIDNEFQAEELVGWLQDGCTITPLAAGAVWHRTKCAKHGGTGTGPLFPLRSLDEIQKAHDTIVEILLKHIPDPFAADPRGIEKLSCAADALCWVLQHDHNKSFAENLTKINGFMAGRGVMMRRG